MLVISARCSGSELARQLHSRAAVQAHPVSNNALASARELFEAGQYAGVVAVCCQALELAPDEVPLLLQRGRAWIALGRISQAVEDLREVLAIDPLCGSAYVMLGRLLARRGELLAARRAFLGALRLNPRDGLARRELDDVDDALIGEEAEMLEEALVGDAPVCAAGTIPPRHRLATQPMGRSSTGGAWRAPTTPLPHRAERSARALRVDGMAVASSGERDVEPPPRSRAVPRGSLRRAETAPLTHARAASHAGVAGHAGPGRAATAPFHHHPATVPAHVHLGVARAAEPVLEEPALDAPRAISRVATVELPRSR